jgi:outer membrane lipoprotein SlyB
MEYVVRTDDGATLAVVQPADPVLRAGVPVAIARGERATLAVR